MKKKPIQIPLFAVLLVCLAILLGALWLRSRGAEEDVSAGWGDNGGGSSNNIIATKTIILSAIGSKNLPNVVI